MKMGLYSTSLVSLTEAREIALENRKNMPSGCDRYTPNVKERAVATFDEAARKVC